MNEQEYERRAKAIDAWAQAQYAAEKMSEGEIERRVMNMFDALDEEYAGPDISYRQTRESTDSDPDNYPGWSLMQSAMRDNW